MVHRTLGIVGCMVLLVALAGACGKKSEGGSGGAAQGTVQAAPAPTGGGNAGSCLKQDELAGPTCDEQVGFPADQLAMLNEMCTGTAGAQWIDGPCPRENTTGACSKKDAASKTEFNNWYYNDSVGLGTPEDVQKLCTENGLEFVGP